MYQELKNQRTIFEPDASRSGTRLLSGLIYAKKPFYIPRKSLEKKKEVFCLLNTIRLAWLHYDEDENSVYCIIC